MTDLFNNDNCQQNDSKCKAMNTLSLIVGFVTLFTYLILSVRKFFFIEGDFYFWDLARLLFLSLSAFLAYFLFNKGYKIVSKYLLIYSFVVFLIYYPIFIRDLTADMYILLPLFVLLLGVFTQIIFYFTKERYYYLFVMLSLLFILIYTDKIYTSIFEEINLEEKWGDAYFVIKLAYIFIFITINGIIHYILKKDKESQREILSKSDKINKKNELIKQKNESISTKNFELKELNEEVTVQNEELQSYLEEIRTQRDEIESKNNEILQSFTYARRIQNSMIPKGKILYSYFEEFFIFNKPKDILSGDFFWASEYENKVIVAVADCTGHGVPASLLSVLGISALNEIILKYKNLKPNDILNHLRTRIVISLSQSDGTEFNKDGMDIALILYDKETKELNFAGAYNPLVIVRGNEIQSLDGDRMPIGICEAEKEFENKKLKLEKDDLLFLFSDGYPDQFGGSKNKKLKRRRFKELLIKVHKLPLSVQKERFSIFLKEWKGQNEQVDDVLIVGLRV